MIRQRFSSKTIAKALHVHVVSLEFHLLNCDMSNFYLLLDLDPHVLVY